MKLVVLQPGYLPWMGFFDQMNWADIFVIYDDVQYTKNDWRNRNRIKGSNGPIWLTIPVHFHLGALINSVALPDDKRWIKSHIKSLKFSYSKAKYFKTYFPKIKELIEAPYQRLIDLNMVLIEYFKNALEINTHIVYSSQLGINGTKSQRVLNICRMMGAKEYLTGDAAKEYLDVPLFESHGVKVRLHNYKHPGYPQLFGEFIPYLSVIDVLFNCGTKSLDYITGKMELK